jgi:hypothetical protein
MAACRRLLPPHHHSVEGNPAVADETKRWRVVGPHAVEGHQPDDVFDHAFSPEQEAYLVEVGHIKPSRAELTTEQKEKK